MSQSESQRTLHDDDALSGDVWLLRQINPNPKSRHVDWSTVDEVGHPIVRSSAFQRASRKRADEFGYPERTLSLFLESAVIEQYGSIPEWLRATDKPRLGVVRVKAQWLRDLGEMGLERDDLNGFVGHTVAWACGSGGRADSAQPTLADLCEWVLVPEPM